MKRLLTHKEIENILDFIKPNPNIPKETALSIVNITKESFKKQLSNQLIFPKIIPELKKHLRENYLKTLIHPGESVGILAAQSIGERQTQSTLNTLM